MTLHHAISMVASVGELAFALLALTRAAKSPVARALALLSMALFAWNFAAAFYEISGNPAWRLLDVTVSPLTSPLALHFVLTFVGQRRRLRGLLAAAYGVLGSLSLATLGSIVFQAGHRFAGGPTWAVWHLSGIAFCMATCGVLLVRHGRASGDREETARARLIIIAVLGVAFLGATDLLADAGFSVPRLGSVGTLAGNAVIVAVAMRLRLFGRPLATTSALLALGLAALAGLAYVQIFRYVDSRRASLVLATVTATLVVGAALLSARQTLSRRRRQLTGMATLGRFSAQMGHDLKNPLAALLGAVEYLQEEYKQGRYGPEQTRFLGLMQDQIVRLRGTVDRYQRLGRLEARAEMTAVGPLVERVLALAPFHAGTGVTVRRELEPGVPPVPLDPDLMLGALENLVQNALEAMPHGGTLTVRAREADAGGAVELAVEDTGTGMDVRTLEQAFDDFYTTKATGSGLGLAFVRRVAEAHGGEVGIASRVGRGTTVRMVLPLKLRRTNPG